MAGDILGEVVLNHPKYSQLLLAANLLSSNHSRLAFDVEIVDMKALAPGNVDVSREVDYEGTRLILFRAGAPFETIEHKLANADILGISANYTFERPMVTEAIRFVRERRLAGLIIVGGHDATADPQYYLAHGADACVLGEGETALQDIAHAMVNGAIFSVPGIAYLEDGRLRKNGKRRNHRFDKIAFPDAVLLKSFGYDQCPDGPAPEGVQRALAVLETSRGCNERCSFCDSSFIIGAYRPIPLSLLLERIDVLVEARIRTLLFSDDNLLYRLLPQHGASSGRDELLTFFRALASKGFSWTFYNGLQFGLLENNGVIDEELIAALFFHAFAGSSFRGCFRAYIPLEKFSPDEMARLPKLRPLEIEQDILRVVASKGVPELNLGFIIGNIRETPQSLDHAQACAAQFGDLVRTASSGLTVPRFFPWCSVPIPGTPDYKHFKSHIRYPTSDFPELFSNYTSVIGNEFYSPLDITLARQRIDIELNGGTKALHTVTPPTRRLSGHDAARGPDH